MNVCGSQESGLNIRTSCSRINAAFPPLCCYSQTDACRHSSSTLDEREPAVSPCKTSAGDSNKYTLNFDCDVLIAMSLCFLCAVAGFSRKCFKDIFPVWQFYYCLPLDWWWSLLSAWVGGMVCVCRGGKHSWYKCHRGREMSHDMSLTILFAPAEETLCHIT